MNLAVSNIAWPTAQDGAVAEVLANSGVAGIEVAPTKIWHNPLAATDAEIDEYRRFWKSRGISIVAAQALLFGRPDLTLFDSFAVRDRTLAYLTRMVRICARLGAQALVFGSPKNRRVGTGDRAAAEEVACEFFARLAAVAHDEGTAIVLEANPPEYGADFVTRAAEAIQLVTRVDTPSFRLHLDTACMTLVGDPIAASFAAGAPLLRHFHASEPNLAPPGTSGAVDHLAFAAELLRCGYSGWVSLEMHEREPFVLEHFGAAAMWLKERYENAAHRRAAG